MVAAQRLFAGLASKPLPRPGRAVKIVIPGIGGTCEAKLSSDASTITGTWTHTGTWTQGPRPPPLSLLAGKV